MILKTQIDQLAETKTAETYPKVHQKPLPIIFTHSGGQDYLYYSLKQAKNWNPNSPVILLGDEFNNRYDFVIHKNIVDYSNGARDFAKHYRHLSTNSEFFELACFQRWFIIRELMVSHNIQKCLALDTDVMIYIDAGEEHKRFNRFDFTLVRNCGPGCVFVSSIKALDDFCQYLVDLYTRKELFIKLESLFYELQRNNRPGGACDMTAWDLYRQENPGKIAELAEILDGSVYDRHINVSDGFEMKNGIKNIYWIDDRPYCRHIETGKGVRFNILHFQGVKGKKIIEFYLRNRPEKNHSKLSRIDESTKPVSIMQKGTVPPPILNEEMKLTLASNESELDYLIPPEIKNDEFYYTIEKLAREENIKSILEIGSSAGDGSTEAFVKGMVANPNKPILHCIEISKARFEKLQKKYVNDEYVKCYNVSSISPNKFMTENEVKEFYYSTRTNLNQYPLDRVIGWLQQDIEYTEKSGVPDNGIRKIKADNNITDFDMVLIDGSAFAASAELDEVYGACFILLDDINDIKNYRNYRRLSNDPNYTVHAENSNLRNGYAIFRRRYGLNIGKNYQFDFEIKEQRLVRSIVKEGMTVFDIGANVGKYTKLFSLLVGEKGRVYAFEPSKCSFGKLESSMRETNCSNVVFINRAVNFENGNVILNEFPEEYASWNSLGRPSMPDPRNPQTIVPIIRSIKVEAVSLDSFCQDNNIDKIDYLKLDVEGSEIFALKGASELLERKSIRYLQFEISSKMLEGMNTKAKYVFDFLSLRGYECHSITEDGKIGGKVTASDSFYENYIAFPANNVPRFSFIIIALNAMPFIEYAIKAIYDFAYEIIIVEGAVEKCLFAANPDGSSKDRTVEFIKKYPDPAGKIRLLQGIWKEKVYMQDKALEHVTGDYVWLVDSDEIYRQQDLIKVKELVQNDPSITQINFIPDNFWKGFEYIFVSPEFFKTGSHFRRVFKYKEGAKFTSHRPPTMIWPGSATSTEQMRLIDGYQTREMGIIPFHYSYVYDSQVRQKIELYNRYGWNKTWKLDLNEWYNECFSKWTPENRLNIERKYPVWTGDKDSYTIPFTGEHPEVMQEFINRYRKSKERGEKECAAIGAAPQTKRRQRRVRIAGEDDDGSHDLTMIDKESLFAGKIKELFAKIRPKKIIETGTYLGEGTTAIIASSLRNLGVNDAVFYSIEINPDYYRQAVENITRNKHTNVILLNGVSVPRKILPTFDDIERMTVSDIEFDDIFVDHQEHERALLYYQETDFDGVPDDLLGECLQRFDYRPDFILLDSAGHMGNIEFNYLVDRLKGECHIALDDVYHIKHRKSLQQIKEDARFEEIYSSREKFGFCIVKFTPERRVETDDKVKSTLWVRTDSIGDNILSAGMLEHFRKRYQSAKITVLCQEHIVELYETCPYVDEVIGFNKKLAYENDQYRLNIIQRLQVLNADIAFNTVYSREPITDVFTVESRARELIAFEGNLDNIPAEIRNMHNGFYTKLLPTRGEHKPELERNRDFLTDAGIESAPLQPVVWTSTEDEEFADEFFKSHNLQGDKTIALFTGAQYYMRLYDKYGTALSQICQEHDFSVIALGTEKEFGINQNNLDDIGGNTINLSGKTTIRQTVALLRRCHLAVGAETGNAHIACAVGTPNVVLLGGGHFGRFMPYSPLTSIVCLPLECYGCNWKCRYQRVHCIADIAPEVIVEAVKQTLEKKSEKPRVFVQSASLWKFGHNQPQWKSFEQYLNPDDVEIIQMDESFWKSETSTSTVQKAAELTIEGEELFNRGDVEGAMSAFSEAIEADPNCCEAQNNLGVLYFQGGNYEKSLNYLNKALEINPDDRNTILNYSDVLKMMNQHAEAAEVYTEYLKRHPDDREIDGLLEELRVISFRDRMSAAEIDIEAGGNGHIDRAQDSLFVSVITPSFNQGRFIEQTVLSVLQQNYPNFEHIVIDGGSSDETVEILKKYDHLKWISKEDSGQSEALNKGIRMAKGNIIAWVNSDDYYQPGIFKAVTDFFQANPDKNIVMGDCNLVDEEGGIFDTVVNHERGFEELKEYQIPYSIPTQPAVFFRRKLLDELGYLDESLHYGMDYDLWMRFALKYRFYHLNLVVANYRFHHEAKNVNQNYSKCFPEWESVRKKYVNEHRNNPQVSVIIPCFNYAQYLPESVGSVLAQTYWDFEIIIVNDGSTDNSREVAERIIRENSGIPIRLINQSNSGQPAISRNRGITEAKGEYILCLDADDLIEPTLLRECVEVLDENPDISIAYTDQIHFKNGESHLYRSQDWNLRNLLTANLLPTCCLFRRRGWEEVGGYNTNIKGYEDWDFWISLGEKDHVGKRIPKPLYRYRLSDNGVFADAFKRDRQLRAQIVLNHPNLFSSDSIVESEKFISESVTEPAAEGIDDKPSILIFHYEKPLNPQGINAGAEMALIHTARALVKKGCRVTLAGNLGCPAGIYQQVRYVNTGRDFNYSRVLAEEADRHDIIIASSRADVLKESLKYNNFKVRLLWMHVNSLSVARMAPTSIKQVCDAVLCVSEGQRKVMVGQGLDRSLTRILNNGSDTELFQPLPVKREPHRIVYAGALVRLKGVHNLVQAFQKVRQTVPDAVLDVFGSGDIWGEEDFVDYSGNKPDVTGMNFYGKVSQKRLVEAFSRSVLTVVPSLLECNDSYPLSPLDAQACECPALVTPSGGLPETIEDGITGRVLPDDSPEAIAAFIIEMLSDERKLREMGKAGRKRILQGHTWDDAAGKLLSIISNFDKKKKNLQQHRMPQDIRPNEFATIPSPSANGSANGTKVAMITTFNQRCGLATYAGYLLEHYNQEQTLILPEITDDILEKDAPNVVRCWRTAVNDYRMMEDTIRNFGADIVHINYHGLFFPLRPFYEMLDRLRREGVKVVASLHTVDGNSPVFQWLDSVSDVLLVHMPYNQTQWAANGKNADKVFIVPHGIPQIPSTSYEELRKSLNLSTDIQVYVSFGFIEPHKGIAENIEALSRLKGRFPFLYVVLGGAHPKNPIGKKYLEECGNLTKKYNMENEVQFFSGFQPFQNVWVMLNAADAILMNYQSNRYESSGATALALSSKRPIVTSSVPTFSDLGQAVLRISEGFPLEQLLLELRENKSLGSFIARKQSEIVQERSWVRTAEKIHTIYRQLLN